MSVLLTVVRPVSVLVLYAVPVLPPVHLRQSVLGLSVSLILLLCISSLCVVVIIAIIFVISARVSIFNYD